MGKVDTTAAETGGEAGRSGRSDTTDWRPADSRDARESLILGMDLLALCVRENIAARLEDRRVADSRAMIADALVSAFKAHGRPSGSYVLPNATVASEFGKTDDAWNALSRAYKEFAADHAFRCRDQRLPRVYFVRYRGSRGSKAAFQLWVCTNDRMGSAAPLPPFVLDQPIRYAVETGPESQAPAPKVTDRGSEAPKLNEAAPDSVAKPARPEHSPPAAKTDDPPEVRAEGGERLDSAGSGPAPAPGTADDSLQGEAESRASCGARSATANGGSPRQPVMDSYLAFVVATSRPLATSSSTPWLLWFAVLGLLMTVNSATAFIGDMLQHFIDLLMSLRGLLDGWTVRLQT
jgi:hypothetical protein